MPVQEEHPIAFKSRKLNYAEQKYSIHEKEMTIVVHYFGIWRVYLLGQKFIVKMDKVFSWGTKEMVATVEENKWIGFNLHDSYLDKLEMDSKKLENTLTENGKSLNDEGEKMNRTNFV